MIFGLAGAGFVAAIVIGIIGLAKISDTLIHWALVLFMISLGINMFNALYLKPDNSKSKNNNSDDKN